MSDFGAHIVRGVWQLSLPPSEEDSRKLFPDENVARQCISPLFSRLALGVTRLHIDLVYDADHDEAVLFYLGDPADETSFGMSLKLTGLQFQLFNPGAVVSMVQDCTEDFSELTIVHLGPGFNQRSCEKVSTDPDGNLHLGVQFVDLIGGTHLGHYIFHRVSSPIHSRTLLTQHAATAGWKVMRTWPGEVLELCQVKCVCVSRITGSVKEVIWSPEQTFNSKISYADSTQPAQLGNTGIEYGLQISLGTLSWDVDCNQSVVIAVNELVRFQATAHAQTNGMSEEAAMLRRLPGQSSWKNFLELHRHVLLIDGLFRTFTEQWRVLNANAIDALCALLRIPQHIDRENLQFVQMALQVDEEQQLERQASSDSASCVEPEPTSGLPQNPTVSMKSQLVAPPDVPSVPQFEQAVQPPVESTKLQTEFDSPSRPAQPLLSNRGVSMRPSIVRGNTTTVDGGSGPLFTSPTRFPTVPPPMTSSLQHKKAAAAAASAGTPLPVGGLSSESEDSSIGRDSSASRIDVDGVEMPANQLLAISTLLGPHDGLDYSDIYQDGSTALKYMPVDMVNTPRIKTSIARGLLVEALSKGLRIIKHGRQGKPKRKILHCDPQVTTLMWFPDRGQPLQTVDDISEGKGIKIADIRDVRLGTDIDPHQYDPHHQQPSPAPQSESSPSSSSNKRKQSKPEKQEPPQQRKSLLQRTSTAFQAIFSGASPASNSPAVPEPPVQHSAALVAAGPLTGTAVLRRTCTTQEELSLCLSLVLDDRTVDIQCLNRKDLEFLSINLRELLAKAPPSPNMPAVQRAASFKGALDTKYEENPLKSKLKNGTNAKKQQQLQQQSTAAPSPRSSSPAVTQKKSIRFVEPVDDANLQVHDPREEGRPSRNSSSHSISSSGRVSRSQDEAGVHAFDMDHDILVPDSLKSPSADRVFVDSLRMSSTEALQIGLILSDQERKYGQNMYQAITASDQPRIEKYVSKGFTMEEAILRIFEKKHVPPHLHTLVGPPGAIIDDDSDEDDEKDEHKQSPGASTSPDAPLSPASPSLGLRKPSSLHMGRKSSFSRLLLDNIETGEQDDAVRSAASGSPSSDSRKLGRRLKSTEALQTGLLLSQQEDAYGTNMYESLTPADAEDIRKLTEDELRTVDDAVLLIFQRKVVYNQAAAAAEAADNESLPNANSTSSATLKSAADDEGDSDDEDSDSAPKPPAVKQALSISVDELGIPLVRSASHEEARSAQRHLSPDTRGSSSQHLHSASSFSLQRTGSAFFPSLQAVLPTSKPAPSTSSKPTPPPPRSVPRMNSTDAVQMAMLLSEQEERHGVNMFDSLKPQDEPEIERLVAAGYSLEEAVYSIFELKFPAADSRSNNVHGSNKSGGASSAAAEVSTGRVGVTMVYPPGHPQHIAQQQQQLQQQQQMMQQSQYGMMPGAVPPGMNPYDYMQMQQQQQQQMSMYYAAAGYPPPPGAMGYPSMYAPPSPGYGYPAGYPPMSPYGGYGQPMMPPGAYPGYYGGGAYPPQMSPQQQQQPHQASQETNRSRTNSHSSAASVASTDSGSGSGSAGKPQKGVTRRSSLFGFKSEPAKPYKESDVKTIVTMGFSKEQAVAALLQCDNNVVRAIDLLTR